MSDDYRSFNMFVGMPGTGWRGQITIRGDKAESGEAYAKRVMQELNLWYGLGWKVERPYFDEGKIAQRINVETDADLEFAFATATEKPAMTGMTNPAPATTPAPANGKSIMHVQRFVIAADKGGLPVLEFYQTGHKWPDLRYSLGKTMEERRAKCAALLSNIAGPVPASAIEIGVDKAVDWDVIWQPGRDPKYKDVVSVGSHVNGNGGAK